MFTRSWRRAKEYLRRHTDRIYTYKHTEDATVNDFVFFFLADDGKVNHTDDAQVDDFASLPCGRCESGGSFSSVNPD